MTHARSMFELVSTILVTIAALAMVSLYVLDRSRSTQNEPVYAADWEAWDSVGISFGADHPAMTLSVFMDFTCPFCAHLVPVLDSLLQEYPTSAAFQFIHFPIDGREHAIESAVAAECALEQGRFEEMYRILYGNLDLIGDAAWTSFAEEAGVRDLAGFTACKERPADSFARIREGRELGRELGVRGTPTIWVNGTLFDQGRSMEVLARKAAELGIGR